MWCVYVDNEIFSHKKEINLAIWDNIKVPRGYYATWNKSEKGKYCIISFICLVKIYILNKIIYLKQNLKNPEQDKKTHKFIDIENTGVIFDIEAWMPEAWTPYKNGLRGSNNINVQCDDYS